MRHLASVLAIGAIALVASACSTTGGGSTSAAPSGSTGTTASPLDGTHWKLTSYDAGGTSTAVPAGIVVDARFTAGTIAGSSGCNVYTGPVTITGQSITVGALATTQMACPGPKAETETAYLAALAKAATFTATADALTLFDSGGSPILVYAAGPANPLEGNWIVTGYNNGKQAVTSPMSGTSLTATFTADAVSGSSGCNTYNGTYTLDGDALKIGPLATTRMACDPAIMDQETLYLAALAASTTVEQTGATVTLRNADGATQVTLAGK
jgi:heat shock protein HslJ